MSNSHPLIRCHGTKKRLNDDSRLTQLRPLKHLQLRMRVQKPLDSLNVLLILEPRKHIQIIQGLGQVPVS